MRPSLSRILLGCVVLTALTLAQVPSPELDVTLLKESKVPSDGPGLLTFFAERTANLADEGRIQKLIDRLGADDFDDREDATRQIIALGSRTLKLLETASKSKDPEVSRRAEDCFKQIKAGSTAQVLQAAIRQLGRSRDAKAVPVLLSYLLTAEQENVGDDVREVLVGLAVREGKADANLVAALTDKEPLRRAAAGLALARGKASDELPAVRKLLDDSDARVRWTVALALIGLREKAAVTTLVRLMDEPSLTPVQVNMLEDVLYRLAEDKAPQITVDAGPEGRKRLRMAWETWYNDHGEKLDLARLEEATKTQGNTLIVLLDVNKIIDLDAKNQPRFTLENVLFPLDASYLPGDRVLIAEHNAQKVTERDKTGKVLWEKEVESPLAAQRLLNGNTLISTRTQILEVDPKGKEVSTFTPPRGELIMRVQRLRDGRTALISQLNTTRFSLLDQKMQEIRGFGVDVRTSGGRVDVLPNGNVLIPENTNNRVVEHDTTGRIIWETPIDQPIAAWRLPNGNTMITSMTLTIGAVEVDRTGKIVWQHKADTRVTRALRR